MCAQWLKAQGLERVGLFWEQGSSGKDYADYFRDAAVGLGMTITREVEARAQPGGPAGATSTRMRATGRRGDLLRGLRLRHVPLRRGVQGTRLGPAPGHGDRLHVLFATRNAWAEGLEGWHGVDQLGEDGANPNYNAMVERFEKRFGRSTRNVVVALAYDTARVAIHGIANAAIAIPTEVKEGMERIKLDAGHQRRPGLLHHVRPRRTTRATRATSSPSASCAAANSTSAGTTAPSGRRTRPRLTSPARLPTRKLGISVCGCRRCRCPVP